MVQHALTAKDLLKLRETTERCIQWALDPDREPIGDTTPDEAAAIMLYTQDTCLYPMLNGALRAHSGSDGEKAFSPYLKLLLTGLNKLPLVRAKVYRGIKADVHDVYSQLENKVFTWWAFSSTSTRKRQAEVFMSGGQCTLFTIDAIGVDVSAFSSFPNEQELLLLPGTCLMVEPGVVAEAGHWTYEASVWRAAQERRDRCRHEQSDGHSPKGNVVENNSATILNNQKDVGGSVFQNTDLPHPGWETLVLSCGAISSSPDAISSSPDAESSSPDAESSSPDTKSSSSDAKSSSPDAISSSPDAKSSSPDAISSSPDAKSSSSDTKSSSPDT